MRKFSRGRKCIFGIAIAFLFFHGSAAAGANEEAVAFVNGEKIKGLELREILGIWGGAISASGIPTEKKMEALERLIDGRLIEQSARAKKLDNTADFSKRMKEREEGLLIPVLFRVEIASKLRIGQEEILAESARLRKDDKALAKDKALEAAKRTVWQREIRKLEQGLVGAAREGASVRIDEETIARIGKGDKVGDNAVLGTTATAAISYAETKGLLRQMSGGMHGGQDLGANPQAIRSMVDRELTGRALLAYARKRKVEDTELMKTARRELERSILVDLFTEKEIMKTVKVSAKEIGDTYARHSKMLVRDGKKIPLSEVEEDIRRIVLKEKRNKAMKVFLDKLRKKSKIRIDDKLLKTV
jgi:hypothetical protein